MLYLQSSYESHQQLLVKTVWMDKLTKTDALTDLYNHMTFHEYFEKLIEQHEQNSLPLQLAIFDIDNFKQVNDMFGHRAGDAVLQRVSELIRSKASTNDFVARYGGEEFAILFTDKLKMEALKLVEQIRQEIAQAPHELQQGKPVTVSVGFAEYIAGEGKEHFFNRVDDALYKAKNPERIKPLLLPSPVEPACLTKGACPFTNDWTFAWASSFFILFADLILWHRLILHNKIIQSAFVFIVHFKNLIFRVPLAGILPGFTDQAKDRFNVDLMRRACGRHHILLDHRTAKIIAAIKERLFADFWPHCNPGGLEIINIIKRNSADRQRLQIFLRSSLLHASYSYYPAGMSME